MSDAGFVFSEKPLQIQRGEGTTLYDADGTAYLDMGASYACAPVGHCHPTVVDAVVEQARSLLYVQGSYPTAARNRVYDRLAATAPAGLENVWLCNSGTEANEAALKFARGVTGRAKIVAAKRGFHGRTMGALATTWKQQYREPYKPLIEGVEFVDYGDAAAMEAAVDEETAAVILEPIQGEGGVHPALPSYLQFVRETTAEAGAAMILDEIQTGLGRTGALWACEHAGVVPDALTTAKGLASGLPMGATLVADWLATDFGDHGSTFSGTPVVSAAADATLSVLAAEKLPAQAAQIGETLQASLSDAIEDGDINARGVRGAGLLIGIEVKRGANRILRDLALEQQVLALPAGRTVVRLLPPLTIDEDDVDHVVDALAAVTGGGSS